ncbi:MAG: hypothetical protein RL719_1206 [Actinomycetota bacterium]|jgi:hypothetical protein
MSEDAAAKRRARQTVTNLVLALGASVAIVVGLVLIVPRSDTSLIQKVDYVSIGQDAAASTEFPVLIPEIDSDWWCNSARWISQPGDGTKAAWYAGFVGPQNEYIGFTQTYGTNETWLALKLSGLQKTGNVGDSKLSWQVWTSPEKHVPAKSKDYMLVATIGADTLMVYGTASESEMKSFATHIGEQVGSLYPLSN